MENAEHEETALATLLCMPRLPLPRPLRDGPFRVAAARAHGLSAGRLRGPDLERPFHGVRAADPAATALTYAPLLRPGDRFSHTTAAELWPLQLPAVPRGIHVTATEPRNAPRRPGIVGHAASADRSVLRGGLPVSEPLTLFIELATILGEDDLVAVGDALVLEPEVLDPLDLRPWFTLDELRAGCAASRSPGCRRARRAAARVRQGAESRPETLLRLLIVGAGLPEPELNVELFDARGRFIGRFDLVYREAKVIVEYDGDGHRTSRTQYERDMTRIDDAIAARWTVVRVRARGLLRAQEETIARVAEALAG